MFHDRKYEAELNATAEAAGEQAAADFGGDLGDAGELDLGDEGELDLEDLGTEDEASESPAEEEAGPLLASPAT